MTFEEVHKKHKEELENIDKLYEEGLINSLELAAMKDEVDNEYRKNLSEAQ